MASATISQSQDDATYPIDAGNVARTETWSYDEAGNLVQYKNPNDQIQQSTYNNRNRQIESEWQHGFPDITTVYDAASRVTSVATADGTTVASVTITPIGRLQKIKP